jgi:hypothetical protein
MRATKLVNNDKAGSMSGGCRGRGRGVGADEPQAPVLWPCSLTVQMPYQVVAFNLLVSSDSRVLEGWKISTGGLAIPPLPVGANLENVIHRCHNELLEEDRNDPNFMADSDL